jgi:rhodanese-related sulfurtransferase
MTHARLELEVRDMAVQVCRVTPEELKRELDQGVDVLILDVRQPGAYYGSPYKLPGAIRIEPDQIDAVYETLPRDVPIVTYCT